MDPLVTGKMGQNLPLRPGQPKSPRLLLEALSQEAGGIVEDEAEVAVGIIHVGACHVWS